MDSELINTIRTRPRFVYSTNLSKERYIELLKEYFQKKNHIIGGYITDEMSYFRIRKTKNEFWAPCLQLRIEEDDENEGILIKGVFGPKPEVWTLFSFLYFGLLTLSLLSLSFYFASFSFGTQNFYLIVGLVLLSLVFGLFLSSKIGQKQTKNQMRLLKTFILMVINKENQVS